MVLVLPRPVQIDSQGRQLAPQSTRLVFGGPYGLAGLGQLDPQLLVRLLQGTHEGSQTLDLGGRDVGPVRRGPLAGHGWRV